MDIKIKTLYQDKVKPTDRMEFTDMGAEEIKEELFRTVSAILDQILDDQDSLTGLYISRE